MLKITKQELDKQVELFEAEVVTDKQLAQIVDLNSIDRATNGLAAVLNDPEQILEVFNVLVNNGWDLIESEKFIEYHNL